MLSIRKDSLIPFYKEQNGFCYISHLPSELLVTIYQLLGRSDLVQFAEKSAWEYARLEGKSRLLLARATYYQNLEKQFRLDACITALFYRHASALDRRVYFPLMRSEILVHLVISHLQSIALRSEKTIETPMDMFHVDTFALANRIVKTDTEIMGIRLKNTDRINISRMNVSFQDNAISYIILSEKAFWNPNLRIEADFSDIHLRHLPEKVCRFTSIEVLNLSRNQLCSLPSGISQLQLLTRLDISFNCLIQLPSEIGTLEYLEILNLSFNQLEELPETFGQLTNLTSLNIRNNKLTRLPDVTGLTKLISFNFCNNPLWAKLSIFLD